MAKWIIIIFAAMLFVSCDSSENANPMVSPVDQRDEVKMVENSMNLEEATQYINGIQAIDAKVNEGAMNYSVNDAGNGLLESTVYYEDEEKTSPRKISMIKLSGSTSNVYFISDHFTGIQEDGFTYLLKNNEVVIALSEKMEPIIISENNKNSVLQSFETARKVLTQNLTQ